MAHKQTGCTTRGLHFHEFRVSRLFTLPLGPAWHALCWRAASSSLPMDSGRLLKGARPDAWGL